jgi:hypothetical protein
MRRLECFISSLLSTIVNFKIVWFDVHEYELIGDFEHGGRKFMVLECQNCGKLKTIQNEQNEKV